jgi:hypothetical protein
LTVVFGFGVRDNLRISFDPEMRPTGDDRRAEKKSAAARRCGEMSSNTGGAVPVDVRGADPPDAEGTVEEALHPVPVDLEEAQGAGREHFGARHEVVKWDMPEAAEFVEPLAYLLGEVGGDAVVGGERQVAGSCLSRANLLGMPEEFS